MDEGSVVLEVECNEPEGTVTRSVRRPQLTLEKLRYYYENLKDFDVIFNEYVENSFRGFVGQFIQQDASGNIIPTGLIWEVDDVGILMLQDIRPEYEALAHYNFWDQRFRGREELCREMLRYLFNKYGFHRIITEVGLYAKPAMNAVERIGFEKEGRKREATLYKPNDADEAEWWDVNLYSILEHEV